MSNARQPGGAPVAVGGELVRRVQQGPAVTEGTHTLLVGRVPGRIDEELASALLGGRLSLPAAPAPGRQQRRPSAPCSKRTACLSAGTRRWRRAVAPWAGRWAAHDDRSHPPPEPAGPGFGCRTSAPDRARACSRCSGRRERRPPRSPRDHPPGTTPSGSSRSIRIVAWAAIRLVPLKKIVEAVVKEERVGRVRPEGARQLLSTLIVPSLPEWQVRHVRPLPPKVSWSKRRCPLLDLGGRDLDRYHDEGTSSTNAARAHVRATAGTRATERSMHGDSPRRRERSRGDAEKSQAMGQGIGRGWAGFPGDT